MTYTIGSPALATDYNNFRGSLGPSDAYPDDATAANKLAALIGVGYGIRGYGQSVSFPAVSVGTVITASQWEIIRDVMNTINVHTGASLTLQPSVLSGTLIRANDGSTGRVSIASLIALLDTAKMNADITQMQVSSVLTSTRNTLWSTEVLHEFTIDCSTENNARYFFNSGGQIYTSGSRSGGSVTSINTAMSTLLSSMGTIKFGSTATTYTGSGGVAYNIGYYGLTNSYQTIFTHTGAGYYIPMNYTLTARRENYVGLNGSNGSLVRMQATFSTGLSSYYTLDGTLTSSVSQLKENGGLTITSPTYTTTVNL